MYQLRNYQQDAVDATIAHFKASDDPAVIVLPTGAGKSLVIAELARLANGRVLVLTHVKELVEQNHQKFQLTGLAAGIYSAGLKQKNSQQKVTFASIQSAARNLADFAQAYSIVIIDECHRVNELLSSDEATKDNSSSNQYQSVINHLKLHSPKLKLLGLTATPYRLGLGWIYQYHHYGIKRSEQQTPFVKCIYELPIGFLIKQGFLTPPKQVNAAVEQYDFSAVKTNNQGSFNQADLNEIVAAHPRVTAGICQHIEQLSVERKGVMIFAATVAHAKEVLSYLPLKQSAIVTGETDTANRDAIIQAFKQRHIKYLVNVSVLTTGFDAPHVDFIAILRPTQSVGLYQQIVGRGLRLSDDKQDCLVVDYAGNGYDLFYPEVGARKPNSDSVPVMVKCPQCDFANTFWGKLDEDNQLVEHYGRRCWGFEEVENEQGKIERLVCDYRFKFKECPHCMTENDIAARHCHSCGEAIIDPDDKLRQALNLADALVLRCAGVSFVAITDSRFRITYHDEDGTELSEVFDLASNKQAQVFYKQYVRRLNQGEIKFDNTQQVIALSQSFTAPDFVIAYKDNKSRNKAEARWLVKEKLFDYQGSYRKANQLR